MYHEGLREYTTKTLITLPLKFTLKCTYCTTPLSIKQQRCNQRSSVVSKATLVH